MYCCLKIHKAVIISAQKAKNTQKGIPAPNFLPQIRRIYKHIIIVVVIVCSIVLATVRVHSCLKVLLPKVLVELYQMLLQMSRKKRLF